MNIYRKYIDSSINWRDAKEQDMSLMEFMSYHEVDWGFEDNIQEKIQGFISACKEKGLITDEIMNDVMDDKFLIAPLENTEDVL